jgi:hypothetical protein
MLIMFSYSYFDKVINVAVMARELAYALDNDVKAKTGKYCEPGALLRHSRDSDGNKRCSICNWLWERSRLRISA